MRARIRQVVGYLRRPEIQRGVAIAIVAAGVKWFIEDTAKRLDDLEKTMASGTVPLDDVATLADLERVLAERKGRMGPDGQQEDRPGEAP